MPPRKMKIKTLKVIVVLASSIELFIANVWDSRNRILYNIIFHDIIKILARAPYCTVYVLVIVCGQIISVISHVHIQLYCV